MHFLGILYLGPQRCCALRFLHALEIDQGYLAHTPIGTGVPPKKNFNRENLKFGIKFSVYTWMSSQIMGISSQIFIQTTCREPGVITCVQFLDGLPPKIWDGKKPSKIFRDFWQLSTLIVNISEMDSQIENRKSSWSTTTSPTLDEKRPWTLVHKGKVIDVHIDLPKWTFFVRLYFGP